MYCKVVWQVSFYCFTMTLPRFFSLSELQHKSGCAKSWHVAKTDYSLACQFISHDWVVGHCLQWSVSNCKQWMKKLPPLQVRRLKFLLLTQSISGCCGSHLIRVARTEAREGMCFCSKSSKIWACCFHIKNQCNQGHLGQVVVTKSAKLY